MSARSRKKELYRQVSSALFFKQLHDELITDENFEGWRLIEPT